MSRPGVPEWRVHVYRTNLLHSADKLCLVYLADHMRTDRTVSVPQTKIARDLNVSERQVRKWVGNAVGVGLLSIVVAARPRTTAVYQGLFAGRRQPATTGQR